MSGANLRKAKLERADLRAARLDDANVVKADLTQANLANASLNGIDLDWATFSHANLNGVTFGPRQKITDAQRSGAVAVPGDEFTMADDVIKRQLTFDDGRHEHVY